VSRPYKGHERVTEGTELRHVSPDGKWWWDGVSWRSTAGAPGLALTKRVFDWAVVAMVCWVVVPIAFAAALAVVSPTYWEPMLSSGAGIGLLTAGLFIIAIGIGLALLARKVAGPSPGRLVAGVAIIVFAFLLQFFTLWIVMLGPALLILLRPATQ
jgi:hypothetical protein